MPRTSINVLNAVIASSFSAPVTLLSVTIFVSMGTEAWSPSAVKARRGLDNDSRIAATFRHDLSQRTGCTCGLVAARPFAANDAV